MGKLSDYKIVFYVMKMEKSKDEGEISSLFISNFGVSYWINWNLNF